MPRAIRNNHGSEIIQVALAGIILIPILLFFLDMIFIVLCSTVNADAAKVAARAAANQQNEQNAKSAAEGTLTTGSHGLGTIKLTSFYRTSEKVKLDTVMHVKLPAPFPFFDQVNLNSGTVVEPVVALYKRAR